MPIILQESDRHYGKTILWAAQESADFFRKALESSSLDMSHIEAWHPRRRLEWLSGRFLIHRFLDLDLSDLQVGENGKPCFIGRDIHISISHTKGLVGLQYHQHPVGLDVQINTEKVHRVASKFCAENDYDLLSPYFDRDRTEMVSWGYKEAVYKAYGKGEVSYKNQIVLDKVEAKGVTPSLQIRLVKDGTTYYYAGRIRKFGPYHMVQAVQLFL